jgi:PleD family two-component response regulator
MDTTTPLDRIARDIDDALGRIDRHRALLAQMAAAHVQALTELKGLVTRMGGATSGGMTLADIDEDLRAAARAGELASGRTGRRARPTPKVLLIDDDPTTRNLISHFLRKEEFVVEKAAGGNEGLAQAKRGRPDLLIVDAGVPGMSVYELLSLLKKDPETAGIPVLMLSQLDEEEAIVKSLEEGAHYLVKPFSPRVLVAKVKKILRDTCHHALDHRRL